MVVRRVVAVALVVVAAVVAVAWSGGPTAVPANLWMTALGVAFALAALPLLTRGDRLARWALPVALLALALVASQAHLGEGFPRTHDGRLHLWSLWSLHRCVLDGDLWPRWNPYMGLGYPLLQFYPPVSYMAAQPLMFLGLSPVQTGAALVLLTSWLSGLAAAWSAGRLGVGWPGRLVAGAALALAPYHLHDASYRFALAELAAFVLVPPFLVLGREVVWGQTLTLDTSRSVKCQRLTPFLAVAALLLTTHLLSALMGGIVVGLWVAAESALGRWRELRTAAIGLLRLAALCGLAAGLVGAFLLPLLAEQHHTCIGRFIPGPHHPLSTNAIAFDDLFERHGWEGYEHSRLKPREGQDPNHLIPFYFGLALLAAAAAAVALTAFRRSRAAMPTGLGVTLLICLLFSAGIPAPLLDAIPPLNALQFPWRFLGPAAVAAALLAGVAVHEASAARWPGLAVAAVAVVALVADAFPYLGACDHHEPYRGAAHHVWVGGEGTTWAETHDPVDADLPADEFVRVERLRHPPETYGFRVAQAHRSHREYMTASVFEGYIKVGPRKGDASVSGAYGVQRRYRSGRSAADRVDAAPLASLQFAGGRGYVPLPAPEIEPEHLRVKLPADHPGGRVKLLFQAFPGWIVRVDDGPWEPALDIDGLLGADAPEGASVLHFRYSWKTPARRAGLGLTVLAWALLLGWAIRDRLRSAR